MSDKSLEEQLLELAEYAKWHRSGIGGRVRALAVQVGELEGALRGLVRVAARCHDVLSRDLRPTKVSQGQLRDKIAIARDALNPENTDEA